MRKIALIVGLLLLTACGNRPLAPVGTLEGAAHKNTTTPPRPIQPTKQHGGHYIVRKGDTLHSVGLQYDLGYKAIAVENGVPAPYTIHVGQRLRIPKQGERIANTTPENPKPHIKERPISNITWHWPTQGRLIETYSLAEPGNKGIDIAGNSGQAIYATAAGKVVYAGSGLPRYGNLLIIKHSELYLSAYAHNQRLLVAEGAQVQAKQKIALMGKTGTQRNKLHFEIRYDGRPIDPLLLLPEK